MASCAVAADSNKFYFIQLQMDTSRGAVAEPQLTMTFGFQVKRDEKNQPYIFPMEFTKDECQGQLDKVMKSANRTFAGIEKPKKPDATWSNESILYAQAMRSVAKNTYVLDDLSDDVFNYYCIPIEKWDSMEPSTKPGDDDYIKGDEYRYKTLESFFGNMKECGLQDFDLLHINMANTPFVCEEYNEENPVPYKTYNELSGTNRWK